MCVCVLASGTYVLIRHISSVDHFCQFVPNSGLPLSRDTFFGGGPHRTACSILIPGPGIERGPSAVKVPSPNHWTPGHFLEILFIIPTGEGLYYI